MMDVVGRSYIILVGVLCCCALAASCNPKRGSDGSGSDSRLLGTASLSDSLLMPHQAMPIPTPGLTPQTLNGLSVAWTAPTVTRTLPVSVHLKFSARVSIKISDFAPKELVWENLRVDGDDGQSYSVEITGGLQEEVSTTLSVSIAGTSIPPQVQEPKITLDVTPPGSPILSGSAFTTSTSPLWVWKSGGEGAGVFRTALTEAELSQGKESSDMFFQPNAPLAPGIHTLWVEERDLAGNWSAPGHLAIEIREADSNANSIIINQGELFTNQPKIEVAVKTDADLAYLTTDSNCSSSGTWETAQGIKTLNLVERNQLVTIYAKFRTPAGNETSCISASIMHDDIPPSPAPAFSDSATASPDATPLFRWGKALDQGSGIREYQIAIGTTPDGTDIQNFTSIGLAESASFNLPLHRWQKYYASIRAVDRAGNVSALSQGDGFMIPRRFLGPKMIDSPLSNRNPAFAFTQGSTGLAAWVHGDGLLDSIMASTFESSVMGTPIKVSPTDGSIGLPQVVGDSRGGAVVLWPENGVKDITTTPGRPVQINYESEASLWARPISPSGWGSPQVIATNVGKSIPIALAYDAKNDSYGALYIGAAQPQVFSIASTSTGWGSPAQLFTCSAICSNLQLAYDSKGAGIAVWLELGSMHSIWYATVQNGQWSIAQQLVTSSSKISQAQLQNIPDGKGALVWLQEGAGGTISCWASIYETGSWGPPTVASEGSAERISYPAASLSHKGTGFFAWFDDTSLQVRLDPLRLASGGVARPRVSLGIDNSVSFVRGIAGSDDSNVILWTTGSSTSQMIKAITFQMNEWSAPQATSFVGSEIDSSPRIYRDSDNNALILWHQTVQGERKIWWNRLE